MSRRGTVKQDAKSGTWSFMVDIAPLGAPRKQIRRRGFRTKRDAVSALEELNVSARAGEFIEPTKMKVAEWFALWLESLAVEGKAPSTIASYRLQLELHVLPTLGAGRLQAVTVADLDRLYARLLSEGRLDGTGGLSARTVRYISTIVGAGLEAAVRKGLLTKNVAKVATRPKVKTVVVERFWTPQEARAFLDSVAGDDLFPLFRLALMTGMRRGEICGLLWADLDLDGGRLLVRRQVVPVDHKPAVREITKTDAGRRTISLDAETVSILRAHRSRQLERRMLLGPGWRDTGIVFDNGTGDIRDPQLVSAAFDYRVKRGGFPSLSFHGMRHSHASHLLAAGENIKVVSKRLGHANASVTLNTYSHLMPTDDQDAAVAAAALVDGAQAGPR